jgi:hypothetical protein
MVWSLDVSKLQFVASGTDNDNDIDTSGCIVNAVINYENESFPVNDSYSWVWPYSNRTTDEVANIRALHDDDDLELNNINIKFIISETTSSTSDIIYAASEYYSSLSASYLYKIGTTSFNGKNIPTLNTAISLPSTYIMGIASSFQMITSSTNIAVILYDSSNNTHSLNIYSEQLAPFDPIVIPNSGEGGVDTLVSIDFSTDNISILVSIDKYKYVYTFTDDLLQEIVDLSGNHEITKSFWKYQPNNSVFNYVPMIFYNWTQFSAENIYFFITGSLPNILNQVTNKPDKLTPSWNDLTLSGEYAHSLDEGYYIILTPIRAAGYRMYFSFGSKLSSSNPTPDPAGGTIIPYFFLETNTNYIDDDDNKDRQLFAVNMNVSFVDAYPMSHIFTMVQGSISSEPEPEPEPAPEPEPEPEP